MTATRATRAVVDYITGTRLSDFSAEAVDIAKRCLVDGAGVVLAGSTTHGSVILRDAAALVAVLGVALPLAGGFVVATALGYSFEGSFFLAAALTATSVGITSRALDQLGALKTGSGRIVLGAAAVRVGVPLVLPQFTLQALVAAGLMWTGAFVLYLVRYAPWLLSTRLDGRDG